MKPRVRVRVRLARGIHAALLVFVRRDVRKAYRAEMIATFEVASSAADRRGFGALCRLLWREINDLATSRRAIEPAGFVAGPGDRRAVSGLEWAQAAAWRQALRSLRRRPAFTLAAVVTLGAGTGLTTAVFALVDTVLIKPLPFPDADRLVTVYETSPSARDRTSLVAPGRLEDWHRLNQTFVAISGSYAENVTDTSGEQPDRLEARRVSPRFFSVFGTPAVVGRAFSSEEEVHDGPPAAVISDALWSRRFQRSPAVIGSALTIGGQRHAIVGVMPASFTGAPIDVWLPARIAPGLMQVRQARFINGVGRLRAGVSLDEAARDLAAVQAALAREFPATDAGWSTEITALKEWRVSGSRQGLVLAFGAVMSLWMIAIANTAGLMLVQVRRRARELIVRGALGASRARIVGTVTREGVIIGLASAVIGTAIAAWLAPMLRVLLSTVPRINELALDWRAFGFAASTCILAACAFSLVPAWLSTRPRPGSALTAGGERIAGDSHFLQKSLVVAQVALSVLLVGSAVLLLQTYANLSRAQTGFDPDGTLTFRIAARWDEDRTQVGRLQAGVLQRLEELPHVAAAGMTNFLPASGATLRFQVQVRGLSGPNADGTMNVGARKISAGYLRAIRVPLLAGDWCAGPSTDPKAPRTAMLNRRFVEVHAPNQQLVGRTIRITLASGDHTIVGVIGDVAEDGLAKAPEPYLYTCDQAGSWPDPEYVVRTSDPSAFDRDLRRIVKELDPGRAIFGVRPLQTVLDAALERPRFDAALLGLFSGAAVTLAAIGLYSLFTLLVGERSREIAVRLALGAAPQQMMRHVIAGAGRLLAGGLILGVGLSAATERLLRGVLFGVEPLEVSALAAAMGVLIAVAMSAVVVPALRASRVAPILALRGD